MKSADSPNDRRFDIALGAHIAETTLPAAATKVAAALPALMKFIPSL
jgi:hypothetical protein